MLSSRIQIGPHSHRSCQGLQRINKVSQKRWQLSSAIDWKKRVRFFLKICLRKNASTFMLFLFLMGLGGFWEIHRVKLIRIRVIWCTQKKNQEWADCWEKYVFFMKFSRSFFLYSRELWSWQTILSSAREHFRPWTTSKTCRTSSPASIRSAIQRCLCSSLLRKMRRWISYHLKYLGKCR